MKKANTSNLLLLVGGLAFSCGTKTTATTAPAQTERDSGDATGASSAPVDSDAAAQSDADAAPSSSSDLPDAAIPPRKYVLSARIFDDASRTSYFHVVDSLAEGTPVDSSQALEVGGSAKLFAIPEHNWLAVGGGEEPTITPLLLNGDGRLEQDQANRISLVNYGVESLWDTLYVVSETKLYYPDRDNRQLIVINPSSMTIEGAIELPETEREGHLSLYGYTPLLRGNKLLFTVGWFDWSESDTVASETGLVVLNTETDSVERFDVDTRCGGITTGVVTTSGDAYFVSSALGGAATLLGRSERSSCALRVAADADSFDQEFAADLKELTGFGLAGEPVPASGDSLFLRVFDEELATIEEGAFSYDLTGQAAWYWWRWDTASGDAQAVPQLEPSTADVVWFQVQNDVYGSVTKTDYSETTLIELSHADSPITRLTVPGFLQGVARIR